MPDGQLHIAQWCHNKLLLMVPCSCLGKPQLCASVHMCT
jgi:hypothetical protein